MYVYICASGFAYRQQNEQNIRTPPSATEATQSSCPRASLTRPAKARGALQQTLTTCVRGLLVLREQETQSLPCLTCPLKTVTHLCVDMNIHDIYIYIHIYIYTSIYIVKRSTARMQHYTQQQARTTVNADTRGKGATGQGTGQGRPSTCCMANAPHHVGFPSAGGQALGAAGGPTPESTLGLENCQKISSIEIIQRRETRVLR